MDKTFVPIIGNLTIDHIYIAHDRPLLFSARNEIGDWYLVSFADLTDNGEKWMLVRKRRRDILKFEQGTVDIRQMFLEGNNGSVIFAEFDDEDGETKVSYLQPDNAELEQYLAVPGRRIEPVNRMMQYTYIVLSHTRDNDFINPNLSFDSTGSKFTELSLNFPSDSRSQYSENAMKA